VAPDQAAALVQAEPVVLVRALARAAEAPVLEVLVLARVVRAVRAREQEARAPAQAVVAQVQVAQGLELVVLGLVVVVQVLARVDLPVARCCPGCCWSRQKTGWRRWHRPVRYRRSAVGCCVWQTS